MKKFFRIESKANLMLITLIGLIFVLGIIYFVTSYYFQTNNSGDHATEIQVASLSCVDLGGEICIGEEVCIGANMTDSMEANCCRGVCKPLPPLVSCSLCGSFLFNYCDRTECESINPPIVGFSGCYYIEGLNEGSCYSLSCNESIPCNGGWVCVNGICESPLISTFELYDDSSSITNLGNASFFVIVNNTNGTVLLEINGQNITAVYQETFSFEGLTYNNIFLVEDYQITQPGSYPYRWISYGNDSSELISYSTSSEYIVNSLSDCDSLGGTICGSGEVCASSTIVAYGVPDCCIGLVDAYGILDNCVEIGSLISLISTFELYDDSSSITNLGNASFFVIVNNTNGTVLLEINGQNITAVYQETFSFEGLTYNNIFLVEDYQITRPGSYPYRWISYGNDSSELISYSTSSEYIVNSLSDCDSLGGTICGSGEVCASSTIVAYGVPDCCLDGCKTLSTTGGKPKKDILAKLKEYPLKDSNSSIMTNQSNSSVTEFDLESSSSNSPVFWEHLGITLSVLVIVIVLLIVTILITWKILSSRKNLSNEVNTEIISNIDSSNVQNNNSSF